MKGKFWYEVRQYVQLGFFVIGTAIVINIFVFGLVVLFQH